MPSLLMITGGLLASILLVGMVLYVVLGRTVDMEWGSDPGSTEQFVENNPEE